MSADRVTIFLPNRGFFGASLVVIPFLLSVRRRYPGLPIMGLSPTPAHQCFRDWGLIDTFVHYPKPLRSGFIAAVRPSLRGHSAVVADLRPGSEWVQLWAKALPANERWCFDQGLGWLLDRRHIGYNDRQYRAANYLALIPGEVPLRPGDLCTGWPAAFATSEPSGRRLIIMPGGSDEKKLWPLASYEAVIRAWLNEFDGHGVTVVAGPSEAHVQSWFTERGIDRLPGARLLVSPHPEALVAEVRGAAAAVHNDCGPGHLAQLVDTPRVVLFPENGFPGEWFRPGTRARCFQAAAGQSIASITSVQVISALREITA